MAAYGAAPIEAGRVDVGVDVARGKGDSTTTWRRRAGVVVAAAAVTLGAVSCAR